MVAIPQLDSPRVLDRPTSIEECSPLPCSPTFPRVQIGFIEEGGVRRGVGCEREGEGRGGAGASKECQERFLLHFLWRYSCFASSSTVGREVTEDDKQARINACAPGSFSSGNWTPWVKMVEAWR